MWCSQRQKGIVHEHKQCSQFQSTKSNSTTTKKKIEVKTAEPFISTHLKKIDFLVEVLASLL